MKGKYLIISVLITVFLFVLLGYVESKITGEEAKKEVLIVKQNFTIDRYDKLKSSMFEKKVIPTDLASNAVFSFDEIKGKYALDKIFEGEILRQENISNSDKTPLVDVSTNMRKLAISINSLADGVGGQIRKNSYVDILFTNSSTSRKPNVKTETVLQKVRVLGVTDSNGVLLDESKDDEIASVILEVTPKQAHLLVNKESKGNFRLISVPQDAPSYEKIVVK